MNREMLLVSGPSRDQNNKNETKNIDGKKWRDQGLPNIYVKSKNKS